MVRVNALAQIVGQCERIQELMQELGEELDSAKGAIKQDRVLGGPALKDKRRHLHENVSVTTKLQDATERLLAVNRALLAETRNRTMVDFQLAAAVEQAEGSRLAALHDNLTGLPNRALFCDRLEHEIARAKTNQWILAVMFVDLDGFKSINDTHGHLVGDAVLKTVGLRLSRSTRNDDTVSRYGGDEFLCLFTPLQEEDDIVAIAAKVLRAIQAPCEIHVGDVSVNLNLEASIGIAMFPRDAATGAALIRRADEAMYGAKQNRAGILFARPDAELGRVG